MSLNVKKAKAIKKQKESEEKVTLVRTTSFLSFLNIQNKSKLDPLLTYNERVKFMHHFVLSTNYRKKKYVRLALNSSESHQVDSSRILSILNRNDGTTCNYFKSKSVGQRPKI